MQCSPRRIHKGMVGVNSLPIYQRKDIQGREKNLKIPVTKLIGLTLYSSCAGVLQKFKEAVAESADVKALADEIATFAQSFPMPGVHYK